MQTKNSVVKLILTNKSMHFSTSSLINFNYDYNFRNSAPKKL